MRSLPAGALQLGAQFVDGQVDFALLVLVDLLVAAAG